MGEFAGSQERPAERKEPSYGDAQKRSCTLLLVLPPTSLARFRPWNKMIYSLAIGLSILTSILALLVNIVAPSLAVKISLQFWIILVVVTASVIYLTVKQAQLQKQTEQISEEMLQEMILQTYLLPVLLDEQHAAPGKQMISPTQLNIRWMLDTVDTERKGRFIHMLNKRGLVTVINLTDCQI